jgi:serine/threonine-protein kinase OSR1/STK39
MTEGPSEWPADPSMYKLLGKIGQGAFAIVWKAHRLLPSPSAITDEDELVGPHHPEPQVEESPVPIVCAVKVLNLDHMDSNLSEIRLEVQAMRLLSHPNVLTCHTAFVNERSLWLVTPLMRMGSSLHSLQAARRAWRKQAEQQQRGDIAADTGNDTPAPPVVLNMEQHIMYIVHETLLGLQYIHENGQIHRDIKAGNILLDRNGNVRIADFGVSGFLVQGGSQQEKARTFVGTPCWMAPVRELKRNLLLARYHVLVCTIHTSC